MPSLGDFYGPVMSEWVKKIYLEVSELQQLVLRYVQKTGFNPIRPGIFGHPSDLGGGQIVPAGKRCPLEASEATVGATKQTNIVSDIFLYL